jgi:hypothetical protein
LNFGIRTLREPLSAKRLISEIQKYDPSDAMEVSRRVRASAGRDFVLDELICLYEDVIAEYESRRRGEDDGNAEGRATARYLRHLKTDITDRREETSRLREQVRSIPFVGKFGLRLARILAGRKGP